jgi:hypothetical protein
MFADWGCIFRKLRADGDGRDKPGHGGAGESIISALGIGYSGRVARVGRWEGQQRLLRFAGNVTDGQ